MRSGKNKLEYFLLEASIFEDMAVLWNECINMINKKNESKHWEYYEEKKYNALLRSIMKTAFNLMESYVNGLAFDILNDISIPFNNLSKKEVICLTEWDSEKNRKRLQSIKTKISKYPKIILGCTHPPIDQSNCKEFRDFTDMEKEYRNTLIHPTPIETDLQEFNREYVHFHINFDQVDQVCNTVFSLILRIAESINFRYGNPKKIWLSKKDEFNVFPRKCFA